MDKETEEKLRAEVIRHLSVISEHWDEDISQALMVAPFRYHDAFELCLDGIELWIKALRILEQLKKKIVLESIINVHTSVELEDVAEEKDIKKEGSE